MAIAANTTATCAHFRMDYSCEGSKESSSPKRQHRYRLAQDHSWTSSIKIPNLNVVPFIADNSTATFHPPLNKGHEAMTYLTYIYEFYEYLPEISIFVHGDDKSW